MACLSAEPRFQTSRRPPSPCREMEPIPTLSGVKAVLTVTLYGLRAAAPA